MNCQEFDQLVVGLACEQLHDATLQNTALAHAHMCVACGGRLARQRTVASGLRLLATDEQTIQAPAHLAVSLQAAFAQQLKLAPQIAAPRSSSLWRSFSQWFNWRFAVATVTGVILLGLTMSWLRRPDTPTSSRQLEVAQALDQPKQKVANTLPTAGAAVQTVPALPKRRRPQKAKAAPSQFEEYGALLSLVPQSPREPDEFQQVVRMQIPRATLRLWGLPVNEESSSEQVSAEVVFSEDGVARAIRLRNEK